jgi:hypothetical protein
MTKPSASELHRVIKEQFGIDTKKNVVNFELIRRDGDPAAYDRNRGAFEAALQNRPDSAEVRKRVYFGDSFGIHIQSFFPRSDIEYIRMELAIHYPVCTLTEIKRIQFPTSAADALLTLRADSVADDPRLKRVFLRRRQKDVNGWSLTGYFPDRDFAKYRAELPENLRIKCTKAAAGMALISEPNGACMKTSFGKVVLVSESLRTFLYYMNAYLMADNIEFVDRMSSLLIAIRTMRLTESPDFDLDPRGDFPPEFHQRITSIVDSQIMFVIGHEYAHLLLGHLGKTSLSMVPGEAILNHPSTKFQLYTPKKENEFDADYGSLAHPSISDEEIVDRLAAAEWFFLGLDVYYAALEVIKQKKVYSSTHPEPIDRIWSLRKRLSESGKLTVAPYYNDKEMHQLISHTSEMKRFISGWLPQNLEKVRFTGSVYLPSYRGEPLVDRIDF